MTEESPKTYRGNCHCGAFIFELTSPEIKTVFECNCSICSKKGYAWLFPGADNFKPVKGDVKDLTEYTFNDGNYIHRVRDYDSMPCHAGDEKLTKDTVLRYLWDPRHGI